MEGVAGEAISLAGHLKLNKLVVLYDSNDISLDGDLAMSFSEDIKKRFESYGWNYLRVDDGNELDDLSAKIAQAKESSDKPTLIEVKTVIGYGAPNKSGKADVHGSPLGEDEMKLAKEYYKWTFDQDFHVPEEVYETFKQATEELGGKAESDWNELYAKYESEYPELAEQLQKAIAGELPEKFDAEFPAYEVGKKQATRASSGDMVNAIAKAVPSFFGGSADLAGSNKTNIKGGGDFDAENPAGRNIWFGVREFAMGAALNGMALHGGLHVFGGTFFVFSDYVRPAIRLAALMGLPVTFVFTHDSVAVGEDGPTHEPVEHLASLRAMPNLSVVRPADANETKAAWRLALTAKTAPTLLVLSRQDLPVLEKSGEMAESGVEKGAYVVSPAENPQALLLATGSEVSLAVDAQKQLAEEGISVSVVSMPSWDRFEKQDKEYKQSVIPKTVKKRLAIEMGTSFGWERYTGDEGDILAIDHFGASAPGERIMKEFGFTPENVAARVKQLIEE